SLCYLGTFGQEDLIGSISKNYHGTRFHGQLITYYYEIDFALRNKASSHDATDEKNIDGPLDQTDLSSMTHDIIQHHLTVCNCGNFDQCLRIYRRCVIDKNVYHSLIYTRRNSTISFLVQYYTNQGDPSFGKIRYFFTSNNKTYAIIKFMMATTTTFSRDKCSQNPRKVFSPSTVSVSLPTHYLIYMEDTVSFLIVARTSIKYIQGQMASLIINKKKLVGEIVVSGTFVRCQTELNKIQKTSQSMDEDSNESESENCQLDEDARSVEKDQENNKIQDFGEESEAEKSPDENFNNRSSNKKRKSQSSYLSQSKKRLKRRILDENIDNESDNEEEIALCLAPKKCKNLSNKDDRLKSIENKMDDFNQCMKKMSHSMRQMASYSNKIVHTAIEHKYYEINFLFIDFLVEHLVSKIWESWDR
ncbi:unnamed protein product, partial [Rotaria socialis]